jgi:hypothetical protein
MFQTRSTEMFQSSKKRQRWFDFLNQISYLRISDARFRLSSLTYWAKNSFHTEGGAFQLKMKN